METLYLNYSMHDQSLCRQEGEKLYITLYHLEKNTNDNLFCFLLEPLFIGILIRILQISGSDSGKKTDVMAQGQCDSLNKNIVIMPQYIHIYWKLHFSQRNFSAKWRLDNASYFPISIEETRKMINKLRLTIIFDIMSTYFVVVLLDLVTNNIILLTNSTPKLVRGECVSCP